MFDACASQRVEFRLKDTAAAVVKAICISLAMGTAELKKQPQSLVPKYLAVLLV